MFTLVFVLLVIPAVVAFAISDLATGDTADASVEAAVTLSWL